MAIQYFLTGNILPVQIRDKSDKKTPLFMVLSKDCPDHFVVNKSGKFEGTPIPLCGEDGGFNVMALANVKDIDSKAKEKLWKQFSLDGSYCYRGVLLRGGFITPELADRISIVAIDTKATQRGVTLDISDDQKIALMNELITVGSGRNVGSYVLGLPSTDPDPVKSAEVDTDPDTDTEDPAIPVESEIV
jgi:hypothetical protein